MKKKVMVAYWEIVLGGRRTKKSENDCQIYTNVLLLLNYKYHLFGVMECVCVYVCACVFGCVCGWQIWGRIIIKLEICTVMQNTPSKSLPEKPYVGSRVPSYFYFPIMHTPNLYQ